MYIERAYIAAWILPALVGSGIWFALRERARGPGDIAAAIGAGWLIGLVVAAECARFVAAADTTHAFARTWPWCAGIGLVAWLVAIVRMRRVAAAAPREGRATSNVLRWVWWLLLIWIVARFLLIGDEALLRPVFPWDAWSAWSTKPKAWFFGGSAEPYVPMAEWLAHPRDALRTAAAWSYPELLAWIELWFASAAGVWNEPLVDIAWSGALAAFALAAYGYWRAAGLAPWIALVLVYGFVSLPLIDAHVALAGYADLWLAIVLGFTTLAWTRWMISRERGQWLLAIASALCLPAIKLEGTVWLLVFSVIVVLDIVPQRWRRYAVPGMAVVAILGVVIANTIGSIHVGWNQIEIASLGKFALAWHGVGGAMIESLFTLPNWHLLWYLVPVLLVLRRRRFREDRAAGLLGLMLLIDFALLFVLFFFTTASAWAQDFTSANRLILQLVPSVFVLMALLLRPLGTFDASGADPRTTRASAVPRAPA